MMGQIRTTRRLLPFTAIAGLLAFGLPVMAQEEAMTAGAVYTATNGASGNRVMMFNRAADGSLSEGGSFATGGRGTGAGLGNQSGMILSPNGKWLLVVNAGSNEISVMEIQEDGLEMVSRTSSGGMMPISLTAYGDWVYVVNAGSDSITGFELRPDGVLREIPGSTSRLTGTGVGPAQIQFNQWGNLLIVTEKNTNTIDTFMVDRNGRSRRLLVAPAAGRTPFGFALGPRDQIFVSEAFGGAPDISTLSSYEVGPDGVLKRLDPAVRTTQTAACWVALGDGGRLAYTTNTGSNSISSFRVGFDGSLTLIDAAAATTTAGPIDMFVSDNGRFLYVLTSGGAAIAGYTIETDGSLEAIPGGMVAGLPAGANGLVAR